MNFIRLANTKHKYWDKAWQVYEISFPIFERRLIEDQIEAVRDERFKPMVIEESGQFIGLLFYWEWDNYRYIEHFAIDPVLRGKNYGSKAIRKLCEEDFTTLLEIDLPIDEIAKNRLRFYEKARFKMNNYTHYHPPYRKGYEGHELCVLSYKQGLSEQEYSRFKGFSQDEVMKYAANK